MSARPDRGRRVLIVVQDLPVPYDRRTWQQAKTLQRAGYAVSVVCPANDRYPRLRERLDDVEIYRYPLPFEARGTAGYLAEFAWCFLMASLLSLRVQLFGRGFDAIHACNPPETYWLLAILWRPFGKRFLFDHHDLSPEMYRAKFGRGDDLFFRALLWLERRSFRAAHATIATNESYRAVALQRGGVAEERVFVVRSGPDPSRFRRLPPDPGLKEGRRYLCCYLGKMCEQDGVDYLLRSIAILTRERGRSDILFAFLGEGPEQPRLARQAEELGIAEHCRFLGFVPDADVSSWLSTADLGVDPDPKSAWSDKSTMNKVLDYMFHGCPVVAFDLTENRRSAGDAGLFVTPDSEPALAEAIEELLASSERRRRMGEEGIRRLHSGLLWQHSAPNLLAAYESLFGAA